MLTHWRRTHSINTVTLAWGKLRQHTRFPEHGLARLGTPDGASTWHSWAIWNGKRANTKHKNVGGVGNGTGYHRKDTCLYYENENGKAGGRLLGAQLGTCRWDDSNCALFLTDDRKRVARIEMRVTDTFLRLGKFTNTELSDNEDKL